MKQSATASCRTSSLAWLLFLLFICTVADAAADSDSCSAAAEYNFLCGLKNPEDLVRVPGTKWIIASGMAPGAAIYLIDSEQKTWTILYPGEAPRARQDMPTFGACPGSPDPNNLVSHGLNLRPGANGHSTLYVVGHGGREAIEVFDVDTSGPKPELTWTGCVEMPTGMAANSVASYGDGSLVATIPLHPDKSIADALAGKPSGAAYRWSPGEPGFTMIAGTELPYPNGIEVSADGQEIYVVSSGLLTMAAYSNTQPAQLLRTSEEMAIVPDNLHMAADGRVITAGLVADDPRCGDVRGLAKFDLEEFASCPRPFMALTVDPQSMAVEVLADGGAIERFSNVTMALQVGSEVWLGTFAGDRVAYRALQGKE